MNKKQTEYMAARATRGLEFEDGSMVVIEGDGVLEGSKPMTWADTESPEDEETAEQTTAAERVTARDQRKTGVTE